MNLIKLILGVLSLVGGSFMTTNNVYSSIASIGVFVVIIGVGLLINTITDCSQ